MSEQDPHVPRLTVAEARRSYTGSPLETSSVETSSRFRAWVLAGVTAGAAVSTYKV